MPLVNEIANPLVDGTIYKIEIDQSGIYGISGQWLNEALSIAPGSLATNAFQIYGIPGGPLRHDSPVEETERLRPLPMQIRDGGDGLINLSDQILFYAEGSDKKIIDRDRGIIEWIKNPFSEKAYVFLKVGGSIEQCVIAGEKDAVSPTRPSTNYWYAHSFHEDKTNLLDDYISTQGSGQEWVGDELSNQGIIDLSKYLEIPSHGLVDPSINMMLLGRSSSSEEVAIRWGSNQIIQPFSPVNTTDIEALYARKISLYHIFFDVDPGEELVLHFEKKDNNARLWLDHIIVEGVASAIYSSDQLNLIPIPDEAGIFDGLSVTSNTLLTVWDVTDIHHTIEKTVFPSGNQYLLDLSHNDEVQLIAFDAASLLQPIGGIRINTQRDLSGDQFDMLVIVPDQLRAAAKRLQKHRREFSNIESVLVAPEVIYNEYSGGRQDPTAIRNLARDLYYSNPDFRYLLLFGDASFDYRHLNKNHAADNLVPTFETFNSTDPLLSFPTDDYYALLDNDENGRLEGDLDIAVGRLTVSTLAEANAVVRKIIGYDTQDEALDEWKTRIVFLADDEDNNLHINDADVIATEVTEQFPLFNQEKIYFDAFRQETTPGGNRYPSATDKLNQTVEQGALVINYLGHGGPNGWAQERVLKIDDINNWTNFDRLPLIITATCSFTGFDDPSITTAGEAALLHPSGGALALFTTVRSVFASKNFRLTRSVFNNIFRQEGNQYLPIGEIMRRAKNEHPNDSSNARKFFLIGDPATRLAIPSLQIVTRHINNLDPLTHPEPIQFSALEQVSVQADIQSPDGEIQDDFNGIVDIIIYDKPAVFQTLANDDRSFMKSFKSQKNIIYKGRSKVINGLLSFKFTVPVDIDYQPGKGKMSFYALSNERREAVGFSEDIVIGGTSQQQVTDDSPPEIRVFLNDRSFINGSEVPPSNLVIVDLKDDFGINVSTSSIGHEITAVIDQNSKSTIFLNDRYRGSTEESGSGTITFNIADLSVGPHTLTVKAFDVANNAAEETINFVVSESLIPSISRIITRPNPMREEAVFEIENDLLDGEITIEMQVYNSQGQWMEEFTTASLNRSGKMSFIWAPKFNASGVFVCYLYLKTATSNESDLTSVKKVVLLK